MASTSAVQAGRAYVEVYLRDRIDEGARKIQQHLRALSANFRDLGVGIAAAGASLTAAFGSLFTGLVFPTKFAIEIENVTTRFETLTGSVQVASSIIRELRKIAATTPFETYGLSKATATLLSFGIAGQEVIGTIRKLGDVAQGDQERLERLSIAFGQVRAKGRLMAQEVNQMVENGFNPLQEISRTTGRSMSELFKSMEEGQVSFGMVDNAFKTVTSSGGRFFKALENQAKTLDGIWGQFADARKLAVQPIGDVLLPIIKDFVVKLTQATRVIGKFVEANKELVPAAALIAGIGSAAGFAILGLGGALILVSTVMTSARVVVQGLAFSYKVLTRNSAKAHSALKGMQDVAEARKLQELAAAASTVSRASTDVATGIKKQAASALIAARNVESMNKALFASARNYALAGQGIQLMLVDGRQLAIVTRSMAVGTRSARDAIRSFGNACRPAGRFATGFATAIKAMNAPLLRAGELLVRLDAALRTATVPLASSARFINSAARATKAALVPIAALAKELRALIGTLRTVNTQLAILNANILKIGTSSASLVKLAAVATTFSAIAVAITEASAAMRTYIELSTAAAKLKDIFPRGFGGGGGAAGKGAKRKPKGPTPSFDAGAATTAMEAYTASIFAATTAAAASLEPMSAMGLTLRGIATAATATAATIKKELAAVDKVVVASIAALNREWKAMITTVRSLNRQFAIMNAHLLKISTSAASLVGLSAVAAAFSAVSVSIMEASAAMSTYIDLATKLKSISPDALGGQTGKRGKRKPKGAKGPHFDAAAAATAMEAFTASIFSATAAATASLQPMSAMGLVLRGIATAATEAAAAMAAYAAAAAGASFTPPPPPGGPKRTRKKKAKDAATSTAAQAAASEIIVGDPNIKQNWKPYTQPSTRHANAAAQREPRAHIADQRTPEQKAAGDKQAPFRGSSQYSQMAPHRAGFAFDPAWRAGNITDQRRPEDVRENRPFSQMTPHKGGFAFDPTWRAGHITDQRRPEDVREHRPFSQITPHTGEFKSDPNWRAGHITDQRRPEDVREHRPFTQMTPHRAGFAFDPAWRAANITDQRKPEDVREHRPFTQLSVPKPAAAPPWAGLGMSAHAGGVNFWDKKATNLPFGMAGPVAMAQAALSPEQFAQHKKDQAFQSQRQRSFTGIGPVLPNWQQRMDDIAEKESAANFRRDAKNQRERAPFTQISIPPKPLDNVRKAPVAGYLENKRGYTDYRGIGPYTGPIPSQNDASFGMPDANVFTRTTGPDKKSDVHHMGRGPSQQGHHGAGANFPRAAGGYPVGGSGINDVVKMQGKVIDAHHNIGKAIVGTTVKTKELNKHNAWLTKGMGYVGKSTQRAAAGMTVAQKVGSTVGKGAGIVGGAVKSVGGSALGGLAVAGTSLINVFKPLVTLIGSTLSAAFGALTSPITLTVAAFAALAAGIGYVMNRSGQLQPLLKGIMGTFNYVVALTKKVFGGITKALGAGEYTLAIQILWAGIKVAFFEGTIQILKLMDHFFKNLWTNAIDFAGGLILAIGDIFRNLPQIIMEALSGGGETLKKIVGDYFEGNLTGKGSLLSNNAEAANAELNKLLGQAGAADRAKTGKYTPKEQEQRRQEVNAARGNVRSQGFLDDRSYQKMVENGFDPLEGLKTSGQLSSDPKTQQQQIDKLLANRRISSAFVDQQFQAAQPRKQTTDGETPAMKEAMAKYREQQAEEKKIWDEQRQRAAERIQGLRDEIGELAYSKEAMDLLQAAREGATMAELQQMAVLQRQRAFAAEVRKKQEEARKAEEERVNKLKEDGKAMTESLRTPMEEYRDQLKKIQELQFNGAITEETAVRGIMKAQDELLSKVQQSGPNALARVGSSEGNEFLRQQRERVMRAAREAAVRRQTARVAQKAKENRTLNPQKPKLSEYEQEMQRLQSSQLTVLQAIATGVTTPKTVVRIP